MKKIFRSFFDVHFCFPTLEKASPPLVVSLDQLHVPPPSLKRAATDQCGADLHHSSRRE